MKMSKNEVMTAYNEYVRLGGPEGYLTWNEYVLLEEREYQYYQDYHMYGEAKFDAQERYREMQDFYEEELG